MMIEQFIDMKSKPSLLVMTILGLMFVVSMILVGLNQEASALSSVVARWTFNDGNTVTAKDTSGNGNNGVINGATVLKSKDCKIGHCLGFDGIDDVVNVPNSSTLNFGSTESFSISLWMKSTQSGTGNAGFGWLVDHRRNNDGVYQGYTIGDGSGIITARIRDGSAHDVVVSSTTNVNDGNFHNIVFVVNRSSQTEKLYIDNSLQATANIASVGSINTSFDVHLGGTASPDTLVNFFAGTMDQTTIYNKALSTSEVKTLFKEGGSNSGQCITPPSNLIGWWPADGNTNDLAGSHTGAISGGVTFAPGKVSQSFSFDGTGSVGVGSLGINSDTQPFSIIAWINPSTSAINDGLPHTIAGEGSTPNGSGNGLYFNHFSMIGSTLYVEIGATQIYSRAENTSSVISPNQWSLVTVTYDGSRTDAGIKIYVNGVQQSTTPTGSGFTLTGSPRDQWSIGSQIGGFNPFVGLIDETEIFNRAITQQEVQSEFNADSAGKCKSTSTPIPRNGLVGEWNFENNVLDTSGTGNHGTVIGSPTFVTGKVGNAMNFNTGDAVDLGNPSTLNFGSTGSFSISLWMKSTQNGFGTPVDHRRNNDGTYAGYSIEDSSGSLIGRIRDSSSHDVSVTSTTNVNNGQFHHIVFVVDRSSHTEKLYVDNNLQSSADISSVGDINTSFNITFAGTVSPNTITNLYSGILDQTRIYDRALSTSEIQSLFNEGGIITPPPPQMFNIPVGTNPYDVGVNPSTNIIYVANYGSNTVSVIDGTTNTVTTTISAVTTPVGVGVNPLTNKIYVSNDLSHTVSVINGFTNTVTATIPVGISPDAVGVNPLTNKIYVSNAGSDTVSVINGFTNTVTATITVGIRPSEVGVNPSTNMIYVPNYDSDTVSVINGITNTVTATITVGTQPFGVGINPFTNKIYVSNYGSNNVSVIDGTTNTVTATITVGTQPRDVGVNPFTNKIYVANAGSNNVSVIKGTTNTVTNTIPVGTNPQGVGVNPLKNIYVSNYGSNNVSVINPGA